MFGSKCLLMDKCFRFVDYISIVYDRIMDRRIQKSRQVLFDTFTDLMEKNSFQKISIKMITDTANVNRGTFYLHFKDKNDLRDQCIEMHLNTILTMCTGNHSGAFTSKSAMTLTFEYLEKHYSFYKVMLTGVDNAYFRKKMEENTPYRIK